MLASHYFLSTFAGLFLPPKLVFFSLLLHFLVYVYNCVCGYTSGYKCSRAWNARNGQMTILGVGPQALFTFDLGWSLSVELHHMDQACRPQVLGIFPSPVPSYSSVFTDMCGRMIVRWLVEDLNSGPHACEARVLLPVLSPVLPTTLGKNLESSRERHCSMFVFLSNIFSQCHGPCFFLQMM